MKQLRNEKGFTIIEVVLVLAIAGLIFLMVFIALPALQRSQADTQRRSDAGRILSQVSSYQTNNRGKVPVASASGANNFNDFIGTYLNVNGDTFSDPSGTAYGTGEIPFQFGVGSGTVTGTTPGAIRYAQNATCDGATIVSADGDRKVAVAIRLTNGIYCTNN